MSRNQPQATGLWAWVGLPAGAALLATVALATPIRMLGLYLPEPVFPMVLAFAWPIIRPSVVTPFVTLAMGLFLDVFWGTPIGQWATILLIPYAASLFTRRLTLGQSGAVLAVWYAGVTALAFAAAQAFTYFDVGAAPDTAAVGLQAFVTVLLYPFVHRLIDRFEDAGARIR